MTASTMFTLVNLLSMIMWLLMLLAPKWIVTKKLMDFKIVPVALSVIYGFYLIKVMLAYGAVDYSSLSAVMNLFDNELSALAGWIHYLAFDMLVGMWIINKNYEVGLHRVWLSLCLLASFFFGPIGFVLFFILKSFK